MIDYGTAVQQAFYTALTPFVTCPVEDGPGQGDGFNPEQDFPLCVIGESTAAYMDTDSRLGAEVTMTLHFWSRAAGMKEVRGHMSEAYRALNREDLTLADYKFHSPHLEAENVDTDPDGETRHGVQTYRVMVWWDGFGSRRGLWSDEDVWDDNATWDEGD